MSNKRKVPLPVVGEYEEPDDFVDFIRVSDINDPERDEKSFAEAKFQLDAVTEDRVLVKTIIGTVMKTMDLSKFASPYRLMVCSSVLGALKEVVRASRCHKPVWHMPADEAHEWYPVYRADGELELVRHTDLRHDEWQACVDAYNKWVDQHNAHVDALHAYGANRTGKGKTKH